MKRVIFLILISLMVISGYSQVKLGPRIGANFAGFNEDNDVGDEMAGGFLIGAVANFGLSERVSIQPEILFSQKGERWNLSGGQFVWNLNYIDVPVLLKATFGTELGVFINAGPRLSYLAGGSGSYNGESEDLGGAELSDMNRLNVGIDAGAGVSIPAGPGDLLIELRGGYDFSDVFEYNFFNTDYPSKNYVIGISGAYLFGLY